MPITSQPIQTLTPAPGSESLESLAQALLTGTDEWAGLKALLSIDFEAHDNRLYQCLYSAISEVQAYTARFVGQYTVSLAYRQVYDEQALPVGPISGPVTVTELDGTTLTGVTYPALMGEFPLLTGDYRKGLKLTFTAGYTKENMPARMREAILMCAANAFDMGERNWQRKVADLRLCSWGS